ncbi:MAG TPA: hypothetical protein PKA13_01505 [Geminicoccaceae bacterium]|nr:hypothetical protein [Geminicoccus sp.]HMU48417.1 hypothetical protein [Geminicoccaceae bacterium]
MLRRHVLATLPLAPALLLGGAAARAAAPSPLASLVADRPAAHRLGRAYLDVAAERRPQAIERALQERLAEIGHDGSAHGLGRAVGRAIADDFAASRTVLVEGWLLAETECRLCALTALTA